ncbi:MAG: hypothetical protein H0X50_08280 [Nitrosopumilus sp.]|nr:hypothetical protein [Nitrosopumilus sp.]
MPTDSQHEFPDDVIGCSDYPTPEKQNQCEHDCAAVEGLVDYISFLQAIHDGNYG